MYENIAFIAPYEELAHIFNEVMYSKGIKIDTFAGDLQAGLKNTLKASRMGKKVFVSRGGTAKVLEKETDFPIVEIKVTGYDLLRVLNKYKGTNKKVAVIGYDNVIHGSKTISDILGLNVIYLPIENEREVMDKVKLAVDMEVNVVIGDTVSVRTAKKMGLDYELIKSGKEAIINAFNEAVNVCEAIERERVKRERYKIIFNSINEGIIATDKDEKIILYNPVAESIFGIPMKDAIGRKASEIILNTRIPEILKTGQAEIGSIQDVGNLVIATNRVPIIIEKDVKGVVATFQEVTKIQEVETKIRQELTKKGFTAKKTFEHVIGKSPIIKKAIDLSKAYAQTESTILLSGESGTGKEVFAQAIHNFSKRKNNSFVAVNCAAIPGNLLESELFGYVEGAFSGARKGGKKGLFELAHKGTIFLDEISEMDFSVQARILRVLQEREVRRIGDDGLIPIDVRIIVATNKDLMEEVIQKNFRKDLYYRINVLNIDIPPLRKRLDDIEDLTNYFAVWYAKQYNKAFKPFGDDVIQLLKRHQWDGNIRELQNVIAKLVLVGHDNFLNSEGFDLIFKEFKEVGKEKLDDSLFSGTLKDIEYRIIERILHEENFNKTKTAKRLSITRTTLNNKLKNV